MQYPHPGSFIQLYISNVILCLDRTKFVADYDTEVYATVIGRCTIDEKNSEYEFYDLLVITSRDGLVWVDLLDVNEIHS